MGEPAAGEAPEVAKRLNDQSTGVRIEAVLTLGQLGEAGKEYAPQIAEKLKDPNGVAAYKALVVLSKMDVPAEDYAETFTGLLKSHNKVLRAHAAAVIGHMGEKASPQFPKIIELLSDKDSKFRYTASLTFQNLGEGARGAVPEIAKLLQDDNPVIRMAALNALGRMSSAAEDSIPDIVSQLQNPDRDVRAEAAKALGNIGPTASGQIPEIAKLLQDDDRLVRLNAASALGKMGKAAAPQAPKIAELLNDKDEDVRASTILALGRIASPDTTPQIASYIQSLDLNHSLNSENISKAVQALGNMGIGARPVSGPVADLLTAPDGLVRSTALVTLMKMSPLDRETIITILAATHSKPEEIGDLRFLAHYSAGGDTESVELIDWLGVDGKKEVGEIPEAKARELLGVFLGNWELTAPHEEIRKDLAASISSVVINGQWTKDDLTLLKEAESKLSAGNFAEQAKEVKAKISKVGS